ncbi:MAG: hypothetical protein JWM05_3458 [Acidimicrobiales bacterium]|nr:hypothetical protein [Acidimicrobiales bacterium]
MSTPTDIQGYRPAVGDARRHLVSVAPAAWRTTAAHQSAMSALVVTANSCPAMVKRHNGIFTGQLSEAPT